MISGKGRQSRPVEHGSQKPTPLGDQQLEVAPVEITGEARKIELRLMLEKKASEQIGALDVVELQQAWRSLRAWPIETLEHSFCHPNALIVIQNTKPSLPTQSPRQAFIIGKP